MNKKNDYLIFTVEKDCFAIPLCEVAKVMQVVEMISVPKMPRFAHGIINFFGSVRPVLDMRFLFSYPSKEIGLSDQMIVLNGSTSKFILLVDSVKEVLTFSDDMLTTSAAVMSDNHFIKGVIKLQDGMVLINDVKHFLDEDELKQLANALDNIAEV